MPSGIPSILREISIFGLDSPPPRVLSLKRGEEKSATRVTLVELARLPIGATRARTGQAHVMHIIGAFLAYLSFRLPSRDYAI